MALRRKLIAVSALAVAAAVLLPACAKSDRNDRDRDADETETEVSEETVETEAPTTTQETRPSETETSAAPAYNEIDMTVAYAAILSEYEPYIREVEDDEYTDYMTCAYTDLTGDGYPELIITYCSDYEYGGDYGMFMGGDSAVYTYDFEAGQAVEMLHVDNIIMNAAGGSDCNIILLDSGNLLVTYGWADEDGETYYDEYAAEGNTLVQVCSMCSAFGVNYDSDEYEEYHTYTQNGQEISEDDFDTVIRAYESQFSGVILMNPWYDSEWNEPNEWQSAVMGAPKIGMDYDSLYSMLVN